MPKQSLLNAGAKSLPGVYESLGTECLLDLMDGEDVTAPYFAAVDAVLKTFKVKTAAVRRAKETVR